MKRGSITILFLLSLSIVSAVPTIIFQNDQTQKGETILATITTIGEFTKEILLNDLVFKEGRKEVPFEFDIVFYNNTHYVYIYANREGNFTIEIPNVLFKEADILSSAKITKDFEILTKNITIENLTKTQILEIKPGLIKLTEEPIIKLINKGNSNLTLEIEEKEIFLLPNEVYEKVVVPNSTLTFLDIHTYKNFRVPIISLVSNSQSNTSEESLDLKLRVDSLTVNIISGTNKKEIIELFNFGEEEITNLEISSNLDSLEIEKVNSIQAKTSVNLTLTFETKTEGHFQNFLDIKYDQYGGEHNISIPLDIYIIQKGSTIEDFNKTEQTCKELEGLVCKIQEKCVGQPKFTNGGEYCCIGTCQEIIKDDSESNYGLITGTLIFIALILVGLAIWQKSKKTKPKNPQEKLKEVSKKYTERIKGGLQRS